jgi:alkylation response protein AidB-like acyl-CoA dehydrogenase
MRLALSDDQSAFGRECRRLFEKEWSTALVREVATPAGPGHHDHLHRRIAEAGWLEIAAAAPGDDEFGTLVELGIAYQEAGRALAPTTLYSCVFAELLLRRCSNPIVAAELNHQIACGNALATVAYLEPDAPVADLAGNYRTVASRDGESWILNGRKAFVLNAASADKLLVTARVVDPASPSGTSFGVFLVDPQARGVERTDYHTFGHDSQSEVTFENVALHGDSLLAGPLGTHEWRQFFGTIVDEVTALLCMEMVGGAERVLDDTAAYVAQREAFGRPIGTFQAVQHMLANLAVEVAAARVAGRYAVWAVSAKHDARREVSVAKSWISRVYKDATMTAHQLFGGAGYVREADLHLWSQRAKAAEPLFGGRVHHLRRLAALGGTVSHWTGFGPGGQRHDHA